MNRVTIGQYYPVDSRIHAIDARVKLLGALAYITLLFFVTNPWGYLVAAAFIALLVKRSGVPVRMLVKGLRAVLFVLLFAGVLNIFLTPGETVLLRFFFLRITAEGLLLAGKMAARLVLLVMGSSVLTLTTTPIRLTDAIEYLMRPLKRVKVPTHEIAMMMTIALGSIPMLMDETDKIMKAQAARGADFETGGLVKKAKSLIPLLVPLFYSAFRRADEMAVAMDARCYQGDDGQRTKLNEMKMTPGDWRATAVMAAFGTLLLLTRWL